MEQVLETDPKKRKKRKIAYLNGSFWDDEDKTNERRDKLEFRV